MKIDKQHPEKAVVKYILGMKEVDDEDAGEKSYPGHPGNPGHVGGSLPMKGGSGGAADAGKGAQGTPSGFKASKSGEYVRRLGHMTITLYSKTESGNTLWGHHVFDETSGKTSSGRKPYVSDIVIAAQDAVGDAKYWAKRR